MTNFQDPIVIFYDILAVVKFWHASYGVFLWEFFTTLDFEWSIIRGGRRYRWTIWIYSLTRISTLIVVITDLIEFSALGPINCQVCTLSCVCTSIHLCNDSEPDDPKILGNFEFAFASLSIASASSLIMLRVIAVWIHNKIIVALATGIWVTNVAFLIHGTVRLQGLWRPEENVCVVPNSDITKFNVIVTFVSDITLLIVMLAGLLRLRMGGGGMLDLGRFLWKQGIIWISFAVAAGVPPVVFLILNLNEPFNFMFQIPALIALTIAATRIYRSLIHFSSEPPTSFRKSSLSFAKVKGPSNSSEIVPPSPMHVTMHTTYAREHLGEHSQLSQKTQMRSHVSITIDEQLRVKVNELGPEEDLNGGVAKSISVVDTKVDQEVATPL
ncbi:hypothetical protein BGW80DRAFT_621651 [Lactifluus volemus]|nr:hypothetical protein BGW80DRAFT_621651 [Lactifluus volemus]